MPHSLRAKLSGLRYKKIISDKDYDRLCKALDNENVLEKIRVEIKAMFPPSGTWMYEEGHEVEHIVCEVLSDVLKIIDKYRGE